MSVIVAISTAPGNSGIGIVRMSGKECFEILDKIFMPKTKNKTGEIKGYNIKDYDEKYLYWMELIEISYN